MRLALVGQVDQVGPSAQHFQPLQEVQVAMSHQVQMALSQVQLEMALSHQVEVAMSHQVEVALSSRLHSLAGDGMEHRTGARRRKGQ